MNIIKLIYLTFITLMLGMCWLVAQDVAAAASSSETLIANDYLDIILKVVGTIVLGIFGWIGDRARRKAIKLGIEEDVYDAVETSVTTIYHTLYAELKEASGDKKITKTEALELRKEAWELAKAELTGPALKFAREKGLDYGSKLMENIISRFKNRKKKS